MDQPPAPEAPAAPTEQAARGSLGPVVWMFLTLFLLYPLSTGPVVRFARQKQQYWAFEETIYAPLGFLCDHCPPVGKFFDWYVGDLWGAQ